MKQWYETCNMTANNRRIMELMLDCPISEWRLVHFIIHCRLNNYYNGVK